MTTQAETGAGEGKILHVAGHTFIPVVNSFVEEDLEPLLTEPGRPDWGKLLASAWERI